MISAPERPHRRLRHAGAGSVLLRRWQGERAKGATMKTACDAASNGRGRVIVVTAWALGCALENEAILAQITEGVSA